MEFVDSREDDDMPCILKGGKISHFPAPIFAIGIVGMFVFSEENNILKDHFVTMTS